MILQKINKSRLLQCCTAYILNRFIFCRAQRPRKIYSYRAHTVQKNQEQLNGAAQGLWGGGNPIQYTDITSWLGSAGRSPNHPDSPTCFVHTQSQCTPLIHTSFLVLLHYLSILWNLQSTRHSDSQTFRLQEFGSLGAWFDNDSQSSHGKQSDLMQTSFDPTHLNVLHFPTVVSDSERSCDLFQCKPSPSLFGTINKSHRGWEAQTNGTDLLCPQVLSSLFLQIRETWDQIIPLCPPQNPQGCGNSRACTREIHIL